jgi:23S rRNA (pseudouridine1915-N3)-methyltransferase
MKLSVLWVGKTRDRRIEALTAEYVGRIERYCRTEIRQIREEPREAAMTAAERTAREGRKILEALRPGEYAVALDEKGRAMSSTEFSGFLERALEGHPSGVVLMVGGPFGLSEEVKESAAERVSLSRMTLTHETARLIALEQVYRAFTILRGGKYHH